MRVTCDVTTLLPIRRPEKSIQSVVDIVVEVENEIVLNRSISIRNIDPELKYRSGFIYRVLFPYDDYNCTMLVYIY